jgi:hypothetical protein
MKIRMRWLPALALLGACGKTPMPPPAAQPPGTAMELRLLGVDPGDFKCVLLAVRELHVTADGRELKQVKPAQMHIDLANTQHAWLVGSVVVPADATNVHVSLRLDDYGGFETSAGGGVIEARGKPIEFNVMGRRQATVALSLTHSLVATRNLEKRILLPHVKITN